jgi:glutamate synthase (NADPH/NADH) small chain
VEVVGHPFGEVCGYICPRDKQCKGSCVLAIRGVGVDAGVVEREAFANSYPKFLPCDSALSHLNVAVIGGGVSGVTFAQQCIKYGANVNIYERTELLHTLTSIPEFRLPREVIDRIVSAVKSSKINVIKQDVTFADVENLRKQFDVVYLSTGVMLPNKMHIDGEEYAVSADEFLRSKPFGKAVVVGGGNTAIDCARKNVRAGFETVIAYRRTRADMPAFENEIAQAETEGVKFVFNVAPISLKRDEKLHATFAKTVSEGRGKLVITNEMIEISCDNLVVATGSSFDNSVYPAERRIVVQEGNIVEDNVFAGGDAVGKSLAVEAVADALNAFSTVMEKYKR